MTKKKNQDKPFEVPSPEKKPEIEAPIDPEEPFIQREEPDVIPFENPFESPPNELPPPGEGP